ncbi:hypothetical protein JYG49_24185, partial [Escherichia fergusonii]|nr:hypothetical protein [Escherichia fergusonii]
AKSRGIRIILDMVFNHTSTQHAWFREAGLVYKRQYLSGGNCNISVNLRNS